MGGYLLGLDFSVYLIPLLHDRYIDIHVVMLDCPENVSQINILVLWEMLFPVLEILLCTYISHDLRSSRKHLREKVTPSLLLIYIY